MANPRLEHSFACMVERVSDYAIFLLDSSGVIQTWNPAAEVMKGYPGNEVIGQNFSILYTDEDQCRQHPKSNLEDAARDGTFQESAWRKRKDGSFFWALVELIAIRDDSGELEGFCKVTRDLTNLKQLQEKLAAEKERAELTLAAITDGLIAVNGAGQVEYVNPEAQRLLGSLQKDAEGLGLEQVLDIVHPDDYNAEEARLIQDERHARLAGTMQVIRARNGARYLIETRQSPIPGGGQDADGKVIVFRDVSERQQMQIALTDADRRKDEFLAMLAHELRNPLAPVSAAAQLLASGKLEAAATKKASQVIIRQVKHMTELIDDLLDVSRISRGQICLETTALDMKGVVGKALEQVRPLLESRQHKLEIRFDSAKAHVEGDEKRLVQVMSNLLNNAAKYTPPGGVITLTLSVATDTICVEVSDNGIGIDPAIQESIFDLFEQVRQTSDRAIGGLGIGLALVRSLVWLHGGTVVCHSDGVGHGSSFNMCLPRLAPSDTAPERRSVDRLVERTNEEGELSALVVDDNIDAAEMLDFFLTGMGFQVTLAHTARAALSAIALAVPDVCVLDIELPDGSGHDLATSIRAMSSPQPMLIALTAFGSTQDRDLANASGFDHYFVKPANLDTVARVLAELGAGQRKDITVVRTPHLP